MRLDQAQRRRGPASTAGGPQTTTRRFPAAGWDSSRAQPTEAHSSSYRQQIAHDIRHELSTIMLLASTLLSSTDFGQRGRVRAQQLLGEARWLDELLNAYDAIPTNTCESSLDPHCPVRLDELAGDVVKAIELSCTVHISLKSQTVLARVERLAFWRALRNVICNALEAAGPGGTLTVRVLRVGGVAVVEVDDDGPGFDPAEPTTGPHGLAIVEDFVASCGGRLEIGRSSLGGCCVRLVLPAVESRPASGSGQHAPCVV